MINLSWYGIPDFSTKNNNFNIKLNKSIIDFSKNINAKKKFLYLVHVLNMTIKKIKLHEQSSITKKNALGLTKLNIKKNMEKKLKKKN